jgi:hypothetical protein
LTDCTNFDRCWARVARLRGPEAMAKETSLTESSLPLHEVLEAEFIALHGELPADYSMSADRETQLKAFCAAVHGLKEKHAALCISGGGIRSATFGLGVLQGLARCGLLNKFHYLSTVSGGGYIGSWLSAWIKNHPQGMEGVVTELKRRPDSILDPEPQPIRYLREFSNYLTPRASLTSMDFWTLIATFIRNMFLNWLVLISWLAAAMMIPRLFLVPIYLHPDWGDQAGRYSKAVSAHKFSGDWNAWANSIQQSWDIGLAVLLMIGFALVAVAMAYAIIDVPSTGDVRLPQRRFLEFRQIPLLLASVVLAAWWAVFRTVHGSEPFKAVHWLPKFVAFTVASYFSGELLATAVPSFRKRKQKARPGRSWRFVAIMASAALAGFCLWAIATRMFLDPEKIELKGSCEAIEIPSQNEVVIPPGTQGVLIQIGLYPTEGEIEFKDRCDAVEIPSQQNITIQPCTHASIPKNPDALALPAPAKHGLNYVCFAPALILAVLLLVNFLFTGLTSWVSRDEDREWWGRSAAWILVTIVGWIVVNVVVLWGAQAISATPNQFGVFLGHLEESSQAKAVLSAFGGVTGIAGALLALRSKLIHILGQRQGFHWLLFGVAIVFFVLLAVVISWVLLLLCSLPLVNYFTKRFIYLHYIDSWGVAFFIVSISLTFIILLFGIVMGFFINANKFSLHAIYRNRLIRAYLAASRPKHRRRPNLFTGFDPADNFKLHELSSKQPLHVINGTLNLVHGEELAWQERKAESFTMSRLHCGSIKVGYRPSTEYGNRITLGTAMAISGAAANPNMGYHSSPVLGLLMTFFNVRLGWWLGNPGAPGRKTWRRSGPRYSVGPLFSEAVGNTTDRYKYVNLSDGGHFENLGLYEMVLRRCHYIVVSDAGQDPECSFADLGEAVRKIRIDFGIPIEFDRMGIYPRSEIGPLTKPGHYCAIGRVCYSLVDGERAPDGVIIYIKPACYGEEPRDIYEYFKTNPMFPHQTTADQFFSESQFESYRMLGAYTMEKLCADCNGDFRRFIRDILKKHLQMEAPDWLQKLLGRQESSRI